ncbi:MAG: aminodeoxychorismate/anthranilate synthase component II [Euryarchaeota archaeon]|nr:aminodeoxychorismate/anthranilate synthase component II [Euryarchaeota archaeon]
MRILLFDNHDSFTWNLAHEIERVDANATVEVLTAEDLPIIDEVPNLISGYDAVVLSPGPGMPAEASMLMEVLDMSIESGKPILGICLGLQAIVEHYGGELDNLEEVLHGRVTKMHWVGEGEPNGIFNRIDFPCQVGHYHSWVASEEGFPEEFIVEASNEKGLIMAIRHKFLPIRGFQFHPESILTPDGRSMLLEWLNSIRA